MSRADNANAQQILLSNLAALAQFDYLSRSEEKTS